MVGQAIQKSAAGFRGVRPFSAMRDLRGVSLLLEEAFHDDLGLLHSWSRVPVLREVGAFLLAASFAPNFPETLLGFVYEEDQHIIGNVNLTPDEGRHRTWLISNVAVDARHRRRGIARQLMHAALQESKQRGGRWIILNVRPHNTGAIKLYGELGFEPVDTEMSYAISHRHAPRLLRAGPTSLPLRRLQGRERRAAYELAREAMGERLKTFRRLRASDFAIHFEDRVAEQVVDAFSGQVTERWGYFENNLLRASVLLRGQRLGSPHILEIHVAPELRGQVEESLLSFAFSRLANFPRRDISVRVLTSHHELVDRLAQLGFEPGRGLMLMAKELK